MATKDPRLEDETKLEEIRRRIDAVAEDAPALAKIALEAIVRKHNPDLRVAPTRLAAQACAPAKFQNSRQSSI